MLAAHTSAPFTACPLCSCSLHMPPCFAAHTPAPSTAYPPRLCSLHAPLCHSLAPFHTCAVRCWPLMLAASAPTVFAVCAPAVFAVRAPVVFAVQFAARAPVPFAAHPPCSVPAPFAACSPVPFSPHPPVLAPCCPRSAQSLPPAGSTVSPVHLFVSIQILQYLHTCECSQPLWNNTVL
ncbi:hypothetical protein DFH08DRAFT_951242 [Mycena albidolilacea]|uniref:Uncharacterized protein n=1 Tax=Mycena albidolilacea TaxID=1033008 RepID=A0AAD7AMV8_9AGAR|nr:hypothetical protein DFH08DRAFT_951242 [Mycena albidolilacea]